MHKKDLLSLLDAYPFNDSNKQLTVLFVDSYDDFWTKENLVGQVTASCWVINRSKTKALMTHHLKLNQWFQLGGHIEAKDKTIQEASARELKEESGLTQFKLLDDSIFDIDVHKIPTSIKGTPEHFHFDIRFLFEANEDEIIRFDIRESKNVAWKSFEEIEKLAPNSSLTRMIEKTEVLSKLK